MKPYPPYPNTPAPPDPRAAWAVVLFLFILMFWLLSCRQEDPLPLISQTHTGLDAWNIPDSTVTLRSYGKSRTETMYIAIAPADSVTITFDAEVSGIWNATGTTVYLMIDGYDKDLQQTGGAGIIQAVSGSLVAKKGTFGMSFGSKVGRIGIAIGIYGTLTSGEISAKINSLKIH